MKRGVHLGQHVPPSQRTTASSHSAAIMLAQDIMDSVEPHDKHVSDATQLAQDSLDKGSPTAHQAATGAAAPRPSDACFRLVFPKGLFLT